MKKKILYIITHLELGGAQKQLIVLLKNLNQSEYSLSLAAGDYGYLKKNFSKLSYVNVKLIPQLIRNINPLYDIITFLRLYFYIKKHGFDIVHTHSPKASILGRWAAFFAGTKTIIYTAHGWPFHGFMNPISYSFYLALEKLTARITKKIIVVSCADLRTGIEKKIAPKEKIALIHYGIDIDYFTKIYKKRCAYPPKGFLITTVSSLKPQKGLDYFLKMAEEVTDKFPQAKFYIIGDGPLRKKIENTIKNLNLGNRLNLAGWVDDLSSIYLNTSLFILTSLWEGLPVSLIEAIISGIPVIVTDTGGILDITKEGKQGKVVKREKLPLISSHCQNMLQNYSWWDKIVKEARKNISMNYWSQNRMIKETETVYRKNS